MIAAIYKIINIETGKVYIGSTNDVKKRFRNHKSLLKNNKHHNIHLQRAWNKYGQAAFGFEILERPEESELLSKEQDYFNLYEIVEKGYNISVVPGSPFAGRHHTDETRQKQSIRNSKERHWAWGKEQTEIHNYKISAGNKRFSDSEERNFYKRWTNGESKGKIARSVGVHTTTISRAIERYERFQEYYDRAAPKNFENNIGTFRDSGPTSR
jgi:group I intron endonuclease